MHVLIAYGTVEGQTRKIARTIANTVQDQGHKTTVFDALDLGQANLGEFDAVIVAAPLHIGRFPQPIVEWVGDKAAMLNPIPSAFVSVSLGIASTFDREHAEVARIVDDLLATTRWKPSIVHHAAGALRYTKYDFFKRLLMRQMAYREGGSVDTSQDHEYTDWRALHDFVVAFLQNARQPA